ncbi:hypothetical protein ACH4PU_30915 [Streptomyces sp. NPDC021100]|uniref:hypothetical protein n=1 Tax=Streptomyces sp. NPDC021100 TaxID=3365114 RepID=UPI003789E3BF
MGTGYLVTWKPARPTDPRPLATAYTIPRKTYSRVADRDDGPDFHALKDGETASQAPVTRVRIPAGQHEAMPPH